MSPSHDPWQSAEIPTYMQLQNERSGHRVPGMLGLTWFAAHWVPRHGPSLQAEVEAEQKLLPHK